MILHSPIEVEIESLDEQGRGLARADKKVLKIPYVIPGEKIRIVAHDLSGFTVPKRMPALNSFEILSASPDRVDPPCPYFTHCGGCQLQHMKVERQMLEKERYLQGLFAEVVPIEAIRPILSSPRAWNYRRRIQLHAGPRGEVGFYAPLSHQVVDIQSCRIAEEALNRKLEDIRKTVQSDLAKERRPTLLTYELTLKPDGKVEIRHFEEKKRSFLQINLGANERLLQFLRGVFKEMVPQNVLELFAGEGNLTYSLLEGVAKWTAVESNAPAVAAAKKHPQAARVNWMEGEAVRVLAKLPKSDYDVVLLDPPREGAPTCVKPLSDSQIPALIYVSCSPHALLKDLKGLIKGGYRIEWLQPFDFFPQTMHLETVALLVRS